MYIQNSGRSALKPYQKKKKKKKCQEFYKYQNQKNVVFPQV